MKLDSSHIKWIISTLFIAIGAVIAYACSPSGASAGGLHGLLFGLASTALLVFAGLLPLGKKLAKWKVIKLATLQKGHIWLGLLAFLLALLHAGFRTGGALSTMLILVLAAIVASGVVGLLLRQMHVVKGPNLSGRAQAVWAVFSAVDKATMHLHIPLSLMLLVFGVAHAIRALYF